MTSDILCVLPIVLLTLLICIILITDHVAERKKQLEVVKKAEAEGNFQELVTVMEKPKDAQIHVKAIQTAEYLLKKGKSQSADPAAGHAVGYIARALASPHQDVRRAGVHTLGEVGDEKILGEIFYIRQYNASPEVHQACYSAFKKIIDKMDTEKLVRKLASEIRRLYSRTRTVIGDMIDEGVPGYTSPTYEKYEESDPDLDGIRELILWTPAGLRAQVQALSGEASDLF